MDWPKCKVCKGSGWRILELQEAYTTTVNKKNIPCGECNGTGERDLTADEAAEYVIKAYPEARAIHYDNGWEVVDWDNWDNNPVTIDGLEDDKCYPKISEAYNAAARAVRSKG